jgi:hypothetical protein
MNPALAIHHGGERLLHGYEAVIVPGGRMMLGRWVDMKEPDARGPFIFWGERLLLFIIILIRFDDGKTDPCPSLEATMGDSNLHGYEAVIVPGGRMMLGRWVDMKEPDARGPFIFCPISSTAQIPEN